MLVPRNCFWKVNHNGRLLDIPLHTLKTCIIKTMEFPRQQLPHHELISSVPDFSFPLPICRNQTVFNTNSQNWTVSFPILQGNHILCGCFALLLSYK